MSDNSAEQPVTELIDKFSEMIDKETEEIRETQAFAEGVETMFSNVSRS